MSRSEEAFLAAIELHDLDGLRAVLDGGLDPTLLVRGKPPVQWLTEMYTRSARFPACLELLLGRGARLDDPVLAAVLRDDAEGVRAMSTADPYHLRRRVGLVSAFTPLVGATLLHVAAEYGTTRALQALLRAGADVDARAALDDHGLGGQTALFHTVNAYGDRSLEALELLLEAGARTDLLLPGLTWGAGFEWETTVFDVTPISYAQLGLLPQMHREQQRVYAILERLLAAAGRRPPPRANVPNRYLRRGADAERTP